ncbi:hypothetical protein [Bradyrhizobium sp. JYMT SZCCT0428]|uniref:hypothetical protein n=1 Tax=Bradyrhizobium sp. JYMT SZCCT0428 TaxID=2807673 RepID=UPI001BAAE966|nr:hypothetical protein [Bradyrhizobium sp. JYMT SZCCT0428]MBR1154184.1 hypothetical protein [Bradyrhizobium sp. JYMT SZCCT0428]
MTYTAPTLGPAAFVSMHRLENRTIFHKKEVESAVRITDEKIKVTTKPVEYKINNVDALRGEEALASNVIILQKVGSKIRTIDGRSPDGKYVRIENGLFLSNGAMTPFLERCLN